MNLYPFQQEGVSWLIDHFRCLLADEPGLGKTIQVIGLMNSCPGIQRALIVCPATLKTNWCREIEKWLNRFLQIQVISGRSEAVIFGDVVIINYDILMYYAPALGKIKWDLVAADEAHALKNSSSKRAKAFFKNLISGNRLVFMTGTPILNRPVEIWPLLFAIDRNLPGSYRSFTERYCNGHEDFFAGWVADGATNLDELNQKLQPVMLRRLKSQVLPQLPAKTREVVYLGENKVFAGGDWKRKLSAMSSFELESEMSTQRREDGLRKVPYVIEYIEDVLLPRGQKIVLFAWHKDVVRQLRESLDPACPLIVGDTPLKDRQAAVDRFQNDPDCRLIIGNIQSMGVGLTLTASSLVVFAELDWVPESLKQAEDRCHRIGQTDNVHVQYLVMDKTIDSLLGESVVRKMNDIDAAVDGVSVDFNWKENLSEFFQLT